MLASFLYVFTTGSTTARKDLPTCVLRWDVKILKFSIDKHDAPYYNGGNSLKCLWKGVHIMLRIDAMTMNMMQMRMCPMCMLCRADFSDVLLTGH